MFADEMFTSRFYKREQRTMNESLAPLACCWVNSYLCLCVRVSVGSGKFGLGPFLFAGELFLFLVWVLRLPTQSLELAFARATIRYLRLLLSLCHYFRRHTRTLNVGATPHSHN